MTEIIYYSAEWCGPCKMMKPILAELQSEHPGQFILTEVDVDQNKQQAITQGIRNVPTIFIFKDGVKIDQQIGAAPKSVLLAKLRI